MITLRFENGLVYYTEIEHVEDIDGNHQAHFLTKEKIAGKINHPLTYKFIRGLLEKNEDKDD
jgi:hypothetical protein